MYVVGDDPTLSKEIEITYVTESEADRNDERILEILSNGVYEYLKYNGFLREDSKLDEKVKSLLDKTKKLVSSEDEKNEDG